MKYLKCLPFILTSLLVNGCGEQSTQLPSNEYGDKVIVAYVTSWSDVIPDPMDMTHINYAFGHVNDTFNGVKIDNPERLRELVRLKEINPNLNILLSIGGWGSGRFSEMAASDSLREAFAADCARIVEEFNLEGIDIDWEYPTSSAANISSSPDDTQNFTLLMHDIRKAIGDDKLLTFASVGSAKFVDFKAILPVIDFVNVMAYDMGWDNKHHAALYPSENTPELTSSGTIEAHINSGVPAGMLVLGMPFYGRGTEKMRNSDFKDIVVPEGYSVIRDSVAMVPFIVDENGDIVFGYDDAESIGAKTDFVIDRGLRGAMYWDYAADDSLKTLSRTISSKLKGVRDNKKILVLNEGGGQHGPFTSRAMEWLHGYTDSLGYAVTELHNASPITEKFLEDYNLVIQLDFPPYTWPEEAEKAFEDYIDNGKGGWIGFHHATLLGEFDGYGMWNWFSDFMGGIRFDNYIAPLADGTVNVETFEHPVMRGLPSQFVLKDDEWYTYDVSPRANVTVLASVDENSYNPPSEIKMGDHPVIWTNESKKARNVYIQPGHSPVLFDTPYFPHIFSNSIEWAIEK